MKLGSRQGGKPTDYGAFVELDEGVEGLIHVSEMSWTKRIKHPNKILNIGDEIETVVLALDISSRRISLGLKQIGVQSLGGYRREVPHRHHYRRPG
ncbi:MAG: S1 RNA-binding domain-containing protein [Syntrophotaleaceae bacterium]